MPTPPFRLSAGAEAWILEKLRWFTTNNSDASSYWPVLGITYDLRIFNSDGRKIGEHSEEPFFDVGWDRAQDIDIRDFSIVDVGPDRILVPNDEIAIFLSGKELDRHAIEIGFPDKADRTLEVLKVKSY